MRLRAVSAAVVVAVPVVIGSASSSASTAGAAEDPSPSPIEHIVVVIQEHRSFDNYFARYPGVGLPPGVCMPLDPTEASTDASPDCVRPFPLGRRPTPALSDDPAVFDGQFAGGAMDGFISALAARGRPGRLAMGYYEGDDVPFYWNLADRGVLFDRFFAPSHGGSLSSHLFAISASGRGMTSIPDGGITGVRTIFDELTDAGVSWRYYVEDLDRGIDFRTVARRPRPNAIVQIGRVPPLAMPRFLDDPDLRRGIVDSSAYFRDLNADRLPAVSFVVPSASSERAPNEPEHGQRFVRALVNALIQSPAWRSSVFIVFHDDWGGWYDHVPPPQRYENGHGFRVPALMVSPFAAHGVIDHSVMDAASVLRFIEETFGLAALTEHDAAARSIGAILEFSSPASTRVIVPYDRGGSREERASASAVFVAYCIGLVLAAAFVSYAIASGATVVRIRGTR